jgi:peptidoglycan hydrolase CwlO-like protein
MKKKIFILALILLMIFSFQAFAEDGTNLEKAQELVDEANEEIYNLIKEAQDKALDKPDEIQEVIDELVEETLETSEETVEEGEELGVSIICEYIEVDINGITVLIDPLRVAGW